MKKWIAVLMALCLLCGATALATDAPATEGDPAYKTTVSLTIAERYTVVIPTEVNINFNTASTPFDIEVSGIQLADPTTEGSQRMVCVVVNQNAGGSLTNESGGEIPYTVTAVDGVEDGVLGFAADDTKQMQVNIAKEAWNKAPAGDYEGQLTFIVSTRDVT